ncbi:hypothetical protein D9756_009414 [Leucocoprinus leucothites]|uniref:F-box domain-containing protein n=1 Tax=Leucocoprinus leucothites TaxID=201217 RepID=A0A8H5CWB9_9AGAR|nr:hypothetical protein D9756_009414 [Leucoagaricus leucothites]
MGHFDEVCLLCGISPHPPRDFTSAPDLTAEELVDALLSLCPTIVQDCQLEEAEGNVHSKEGLESFLTDLIYEFQDFSYDFASAFSNSIAIGYFDDDGAVPHLIIDGDPIARKRIPDGQFVTTRIVESAECGEFEKVVVKKEGEDGTVIKVSEKRMSRTCAYWQGGIGNFFLSEACYRFLEAWIVREYLPPMWDGRVLSFAGELWEVVSSRETGRNGQGYLDWLEPGGAEKKLEQVQYHLSTGDVLPTQTAGALKEGYSRMEIKVALLEDYGYWMFTSPHEWPCRDPDYDVELSLEDIGLDVAPRSDFHSRFALGVLSCFSPEVLTQIFGWLPSIWAYLNLKVVSKAMHNLIVDSRFTMMVFREMLQPDPRRALYWVHPIKEFEQEEEVKNFVEALQSWAGMPSNSKTISEDFILSSEFPVIQFIHSLYMTDEPRNRRRLWSNIQRLKEVWVDYRKNGWKVNRFGAPYLESD